MAENLFNELSMEDLQDSFVEELTEESLGQDTPPIEEEESTLTPSSEEDDDNLLEKEISEFTEEDQTREEEDESETESVAESSEDDGEPPVETGEKYSLLASALHDNGVLPSLSTDKIKEIKSFEDLSNAVAEEISKNEFAGLNDHQRKILEAFNVGIPTEQVNAFKTDVIKYDTLTEEDLQSNDELRINLIKEDFISKGYSEEKATKLAQRSVDTGEDLEDAKEALEGKKAKIRQEFEDKIKKYESYVAEQAEAQKKRQEEFKNLVFNETNEVIPGVKFSKILASKVYDSVTKPVGVTEDGKPYNEIAKARMKDPINFEYKLAYLFNITNGFEKFDNLISSAKSQSAKQLDELLNKNTFKNTTGTPRNDVFDEKAMQSALNKLDKIL